jgi:hypothetical protein
MESKLFTQMDNTGPKGNKFNIYSNKWEEFSLTAEQHQELLNNAREARRTLVPNAGNRTVLDLLKLKLSEDGQKLCIQGPGERSVTASAKILLMHREFTQG